MLLCICITLFIREETQLTEFSAKRIIAAVLSAVMILCAVFCVGAASPENAKMKVIDLSKWNDSIDWSKTSKAVDGVIARIGYRGSVNRDSIVEDNLFSSHYNACVKYSVPFGCYFFSTALNTAQAVEEARWVINTLKKYDCKPEFPVYIDMEDTQVQNSLTNSQRTAIAKAFCTELINNGYYPGIYANKYWMTSLLNMSQLTEASVWVVQYATECSYAGKYDMWQYTETGTVSGIKGNVDVNVCYRDYPSFIKKYGYNGFDKTGGDEEEQPPTADTSKFGTYKITVDSMNVRTGAGTEFDIAGSLSRGDEFYVYDEKDGWGLISFSNSTGWISLNSAYSSKISDYITTKNSLGFYCVNTDALNVRSGAGTSNSKVGTLSRGDTVFITALSGNWGSYSYGYGKKGWICLDYTVFNGVVSFNAGAGKGTMKPQTIPSGTSAALPKCSFTLNGESFYGWSLKSGGDKVYDDGASFTMGKSNVTLYALYSGSPYSAVKNGAKIDKANSLIIITDEKVKLDGFVDRYFDLVSGAVGKLEGADGVFAGTGSVVTLSYNGKAESYTVSLKGDINGDGMRDSLDLADIAAIIYGSSKSLSAAARSAADLNSDSKIDSADADILKDVVFNGSPLPLDK